MDLAQKIKEARNRTGMSVHDAAEKAGVSWSYWYKIEANELKNPSIAILTKMTYAVGIAIHDVLAEPSNA